MKRTLLKLKPAVRPRTLLLLAGLLWVGVGSLLVTVAVGWLRAGPAHLYLLSALGAVAALVIHHFGFLRVVDQNLGRILPLEGKRCAFSFLSWRSYLMIGVMMTLGFLLRHSPIPKPYLAVVYLGIGLALILSSVRYLRMVATAPKS